MITNDKPFKVVSEQVAILKNRGISIIDQKSAEQFLIMHNYYSMINDYGKFFTVSSDVYIPSVTLKDINSAFIFDKSIKGILFIHLLEVEKYLKATLAYYFCLEHPVQYDYLNINCYRHATPKDRLNAVCY